MNEIKPFTPEWWDAVADEARLNMALPNQTRNLSAIEKYCRVRSLNGIFKP